MAAQIRPTRIEVTDRFPMLGFTIVTDSPPRLAEVVVATDPALFTRRDGRTPSTFYTSREHGVLTVAGREAVYTLPAEVLARFVAADRLYFGLATAPAPRGDDWTVEVLPTASSPYVSLSGLSDRALRRVRMFPTRRPGTGYGTAGGGAPTWSGDKAQPGTAPVAPAQAPAAATPAAPAAHPTDAHHYDDGFGPLPPLPHQEPRAAPAAGAPAAAPAQPTAPAAQGQSWSRGLADDDDPETRGIDAAPYAEEDTGATAQASALALTGTGDYAGVTRVAPSPAFTPGRSGTAIDRIVIHITDAPTTSSTVNTFTAAGAQASAHYLVGQDGAVIQFVAEADTAWHARGANRRSIGIEHVAIKRGGADYPTRGGGTRHFDALAPSDAEYSASAALVADICRRCSLTPDRTTIIGHREADRGTSHSSCPDGNWDWDRYMGLVAAAYAAATGGGAGAGGSAPAPDAGAQSLGASARALDADTDTIEIRYRAFIPSPAIKGPPLLPNFHGDGRGFSYGGGTSRGEITLLVDMTPGGGLTNLRVTDRHWSPTMSYDSSDTPAVAGKPDWWLGLNPGARPTDTGTCPTDDDTLRAVFGSLAGSTRDVLSMAEHASIVSVFMSGNNPLVPLSPAIDADIAILLRRNGTGIEAKAVGSHDGFPAHELYVNRVPLHRYDPVASGKGPGSLFDPLDEDVDTPWVQVATAAASAQALSDDIPLDPGVGGMSIGPDALQIGDIIVSTTTHASSAIIRAFSGAPVSHALLYVGQGGQVIEAVGDGVVMRPLADAVAGSNLAVAFRLPDMDDTKRQQIADAAAQYVGRPYNFGGLLRYAAFKVDTSLCSLLPNGAGQRCRAFVGRIDLGPDMTDRFFCSQLILQAFLDAGRQLTTDAPQGVSPGEIADLRLRDGLLAYVGHLKAPIPQRSLFGVSLGMIDAVRGRAAALDADDWSVNWDDVQLIPQPTAMGCWATAAAIVVGWRDNMSVSPQLLAQCNNMAGPLATGLSPADKRAFADAVGLKVHPNACYTPEGFRDILEANGPVWVTEKDNADGVSFTHAIVVTGMYRENGRYFVRVTDPMDRTVGTPGAPGARHLPLTHNTGSRYIMTWEAFTQEFEAAGDVDRIQLVHSGGTFGHTINRGSAAAVGYAQGVGDDGGAGAAGSSVSRQLTEKNGRRYDLAQLTGFIRPANALAGGAGTPALPGERVVLDDWPYIQGPSGRTQAGVAIDWQYQGGAVGNVVIAPVDGQALDGWSAVVRADIEQDASTPDRVMVKVRVTTTFSRQGEEDQVGVTEVSLAGDGRQQTRHGAEPAGARAAAPAARENA